MAATIDHLTIANRDRVAADRHYRRLLPLVGFTEEKPGIWHDGSGFYLQMITAKPEAGEYERHGAGLNHWGLSMPSREAVEKLRTDLISAGYEAQELQELGGALALFVPDPDGLRAEFTFYPSGMPPVG